MLAQLQLLLGCREQILGAGGRDWSYPMNADLFLPISLLLSLRLMVLVNVLTLLRCQHVLLALVADKLDH